MRRVLLLLATVLLGAPAAAETAGAAACRHYENRARFEPREGAVEFPAVLAEACVAARGTLADPVAPERRRAAARALLERLDAARATVRAMDAERFAAARAAAPTGQPVQRDMRSGYRLVSPTGEYLILRDHGVFRLLRAWVDEGADFALIAALPGGPTPQWARQ